MYQRVYLLTLQVSRYCLSVMQRYLPTLQVSIYYILARAFSGVIDSRTVQCLAIVSEPTTTFTPHCLPSKVTAFLLCESQLPSKQETLTQCWPNSGPPSITPWQQHWSARIQDKLSPNASLMLAILYDRRSAVKQHWRNVSFLPGETGKFKSIHWAYVRSMLKLHHISSP